MVDQVGLGRAQSLALSSDPQEVIEVRQMANDFVDHWVADAIEPQSVSGWVDPRGATIEGPAGPSAIEVTAASNMDVARSFASTPPEEHDIAEFEQSRMESLEHAVGGVSHFAQTLASRGGDSFRDNATSQAEGVEKRTPDKIGFVGLDRRQRRYQGGDPTFDFEYGNAERHSRSNHYETGETRLKDN